MSEKMRELMNLMESSAGDERHRKAKRHVFGRLLSKMDGMAHDAGNELFGDDRDRLHDLTRAILDDDESAVENEVLTKVVPDLAYAEDGPRWDFIEQMADYAGEEFSKYYAIMRVTEAVLENQLESPSVKWYN